jgi:tripartite-type tricarboxylate transporter receptor subunit TctC
MISPVLAASHSHVQSRPRLGGAVVFKVIAALVLCSTLVGNATAQVYPSRPITMVVPFAAGGPTDVLARILAERMRGSLGQPVIIENVTGASGTIGVGRVARAPGDGYTLSIGPWNSHVVSGAVYPLNFDLLKDLEPVALLASNDALIVSKNAVPAANLRELIAWVKANQATVSAGTSGQGAGTHVAGIMFQNVTDTKFQFIPYRGAGPALQAVVAGQVDLIFDQASNSLPHVRSGTTRAYAVMGKTRLAFAPEIPTVDEAGLPGLYISVWHGLWASKGTPKEIVVMLNRAVVEALADPAVKERLAALGQDIPARDQQSPEALGAFHKAEIEKWWPIIKAANIKVE